MLTYIEYKATRDFFQLWEPDIVDDISNNHIELFLAWKKTREGKLASHSQEIEYMKDLVKNIL